jgi:DNA-binding beta-propeller fold protein YncE
MKRTRHQIRDVHTFSKVLGPIFQCDDYMGVLDNGNGCIILMNREMEGMVTVGSKGDGAGQFRSLSGAAVNSRGDIFVSDAVLGRIQVFDASGKYLRLFSDRISCPAGIAVTAEDNLLVCDALGDKVLVFDDSGRMLTSFGSSGTELGQFDRPCAVCITEDRNIIVVDYGNHRVQRFDCQGVVIGKIGSNFMNPVDVAVGKGGDIAVADFHEHIAEIQIFDSIGNIRQRIRCPKEKGQGPRGVAMDKYGGVSVAFFDRVDIHQLY